MVWGLALVALIAFMLAFISHSPGWMGLGIFIGFISAIGAALAFIDRHVRASSRPEHMTDREIQALRSTVKKPGETPPRLPPSDPS
ncbi:MAG TPA: hypothetical protein VHD89_07145 [Rhodanobacteraceae bacterium]|jgi:hypothetical protein|nr:hypothetical protein [Rhodanobacteraceae bacterium]